MKVIDLRLREYSRIMQMIDQSGGSYAQDMPTRSQEQMWKLLIQKYLKSNVSSYQEWEWKLRPSG
jgi:hypothetical protein